jgi:HAD superfamily hydrolase (TIGR01509 family)
MIPPDGPVALIFDIDGTLVDTEPANAAASVRVFRELCGVEVIPEEFRPFVGTGDRRYLQGVAERRGVAIDLDRATALRERYLLEVAVPGGLRAFPGMADVVAAARRCPDVRVAVATSGKREKSRRLLAAAGFDPDGWDAYVTAEDVARPKPAPDLFRAAADRLGVASARCVVIEDAPSGVAAARAAGMICVAVVQSSPPEALAGAHRVVRRIDELGLEGLLALVGAA